MKGTWQSENKSAAQEQHNYPSQVLNPYARTLIISHAFHGHVHGTHHGFLWFFYPSLRDPRGFFLLNRARRCDHWGCPCKQYFSLAIHYSRCSLNTFVANKGCFLKVKPCWKWFSEGPWGGANSVFTLATDTAGICKTNGKRRLWRYLARFLT